MKVRIKGVRISEGLLYIDLDKLVGVLQKRSDLWRDLASAMKIPEEQIEVIRGHSQSDLDSLAEVCDAWLKDESMLPTWQAVISALEEVGAKELAEELKSGEDTPAKSENNSKGTYWSYNGKYYTFWIHSERTNNITDSDS